MRVTGVVLIMAVALLAFATWVASSIGLLTAVDAELVGTVALCVNG